ncbi:MAG TPA: hypothetical protein VFG04_02960 [Planctomycetaceae bacterium]|jgi:hypothetical protein|nr:hypothetical protein [Planctomycetaceae bacterium]
MGYFLDQVRRSTQASPAGAERVRINRAAPPGAVPVRIGTAPNPRKTVLDKRRRTSLWQRHDVLDEQPDEADDATYRESVRLACHDTTNSMPTLAELRRMKCKLEKRAALAELLAAVVEAPDDILTPEERLGFEKRIKNVLDTVMANWRGLT